MIRIFLCLPLLATCTLAVGADASVEHGTDEQKQFFRAQVRPLLKQKCLGCHGDGEELKGEFEMRTRAGVLAGGQQGPGATPGDLAESPIYQAVLRTGDLVMPPKDRNALSEEQIATIRRWVEMGLPWSDAASAAEDWSDADGVLVKTSGGLDDNWTNRRYRPEDLWAFLPVKEVEVPKTGHANPIDAFIHQRLAEQKIKPAPPADPRTWLRRITFDLTGLPPTPEELAKFEEEIAKLKKEGPHPDPLPKGEGDTRPHPDPLPEGEGEAESALRIPQSAINSAVDRLLSSKHYGERMAQHWLDVVRYADSAGFANDWERPHAWRYRDYVVRSFNDDKPYDRFIIEQIAGDELRHNDPELKIAVGFLRMGPWEQTAMSVAAVTRQHFLDDVTNSVGLTFLGQGMSCCKCHDHKFDPLPTRDYYRLQAVFASTEFDEAPAKFLPEENTSQFDRRAKEVAVLADAKDWMEIKGDRLDSATRLTKKRARYMDYARDRFSPKSFSVKSSSGQKVNILTGGALESPGEQVSPGVLSAVRFNDEGDIDPKSWQVTGALDGRRLQLAKWIAHRDNPLTARVIVNRVWQMHFGTGLVATPSNFGKMGSKPTHPELLDWLATWLVRNGWSLKKLHRLILTSETYAQAASHPEIDRLAQFDPNNKLLAYFPARRLTAEEIRDAMLAVSGELNDEVGGPPVYPQINWEVAMQPRHIMGGVAPAYQPSPAKGDRDRRSLYAAVIRTLTNPMLEVLNRPGPDLSCERRDETTVTPQVFALFNGQSVHNRALALAQRLEKERGTTDERIDRAFALLFGRTPSDAERDACRAHIEKMTAHHRQHPPEKTELPVTVAREMVDEQTGKPFRWEEKLHWMLDYERDTMPWEVSAETRGLAELCLVLLNSNEFVYVY